MTGADDLRTDHLESDLALRSARGSISALAAEGAKFVAGTGSMVVLARLLHPDDFGVVAMALATVGILVEIKDAGLFTATVQSRQIVQGQATALFWMSAALATASALLTLILAPALGWFYGDQRLVPITAALAVVPLLDGTTMQLQAVMTRQMRFAALSVMDAASLVVSVIAALAFAAAGAGYWALVWQELLYSAAYAAAIWTVCRWRPGRPTRESAIRPMVAFGLHLSGFRVLNYLAMNLDTVFVGRFRGSVQAGIYDRAFRLFMIPLMLFKQPLNSVAVPTLSRLQGDAERYRVFYRAWTQLLFAMSMPVVVFLFVDAERAVLTILGTQWIGLVPIYRVLAPAAFVGRLNSMTSWVYISTGRTDRQFRWSAFILVPLVAAYAIGVNWGAFGVAVAHTVVTCTFWYPGLAYCCRTAPVRPHDMFSALAMPAAASVAAGVGLVGIATVLPQSISVPLQLAVDLVVYTALYATAWMAVPRGRQSLAGFIELARKAIGSEPVIQTTALPR